MTLSRVLLLPVVLVLYLFSVFWVGTVLQLQAGIPRRAGFSVHSNSSRNSWSSDWRQWSGTSAPEDSGASKMENKRQSLSINTTEVASEFVILASILMFGSRCGVFALCM